jgi:hypothetical protein
MQKLNEISKKLEEAQALMKSQGKEALEEAFMEFFQKHPEARAIVWCQYTPYFNDGEPCEFRAGSAELKVDPSKMAPDVLKALNIANEERDEDEDDEEYNYQHGDGCATFAFRMLTDETSRWLAGYREERGISLRSLTPSEEWLNNDFKNLASQLDKLAELLQMVLGDHIVVKVTADGIETSDYEHD